MDKTFAQCVKCGKVDRTCNLDPLTKEEDQVPHQLAGHCSCGGMAKRLDQSDNDEVQKGVDVAREVSNGLNSYHRLFEEGFAIGVSFDHRTLQQAFGRLMMGTIRRFAEMKKNGHFDARNEAVCSLAAEIMEKVGDKHLPFI